ncbi:MAG: recombinase family protein [Oscillospiraceae bacterium]|nr:recombinase family protein [Oscillospiraceae bacterium]
MAGKHTASLPSYGYLKSPDDKDQWVIDPVAAPIVKRIFLLSMDGKGPYQIAQILSDEKVDIPAYHHQKLGIGLYKSREIKNPYLWRSTTIAHILENPVYLGHTCNFKTRKHFKDKRSHYVDQDEWTIIENTHEAIIDQDTFDNVQRLRSNIRRYPDGWGETHPLSGLMFCADCGSVMYIHRVNNGKRVPTFDCSSYHKTPVGSLCPSAHRIHASVVMTLVKETLKEIVKFSAEDEAEFRRPVEEAVASQQDSAIKEQKSRLAACLKRREELEVLICKIYEDNALGKLPDVRYQLLDAQYAGEQATLEQEIQELQEAVGKSEKKEYSASKFIALVRKYQDFEELTTPMLIEFVDKILVHERDVKGRFDSPQTIEIYFNFVGQFSAPHDEAEPTLEEIELEQRREATRQRRHEEYLRSKSTGWQATYYWKNKRAKKAKMDAAKEKIRAEDRENGIYYLPKQQGSTRQTEEVAL